jgi:hypothetical protein
MKEELVYFGFSICKESLKIDNEKESNNEMANS